MATTGVELATAYINLVPSMRGAGAAIRRDLGEVEREGVGVGQRTGAGIATGIGASIKRAASTIVAPLAAAFGAVKVVQFFSDSVRSASDFAEAGNKINLIFGEQGAAAIQAFARSGATALGQSTNSVLTAASTFGVFGKSAGLAGEDLTGFSTGLTTLSTDLASFYNTSPEQAITAIGAALRGESEPIRAYGVLLDDASMRQEALRLGLISTTNDALTPQQKILAAQSLIYQQTSDAQGDFSRTSGGLANQQRILGAQFENIKTTVGSFLLPILTSLATTFTTKIMPAIAGFIDQWRNGEGTAGRVRDVFSTLGDTLTGTVVPAFQNVVGWVKQNSEWLSPLVLMVLSAVAGWKAYTTALGIWRGVQTAAIAVQLAWNTAMAMNPIGLVVAAIAALVAGIIWAYNNVDWFRNAVDAAFAWIKNAIATVADWWTGTVVPAWNAGYDAVAGVVQTVSNAIGAAWQWISDAAGAAWDFIYTWVLLPFRLEAAVLQRVFEVASQALGAAWEWIRNAAGVAWAWIQTNVFPPFEFAINSIKGVFEVYGQVASTVWEGIRSAIGAAWQWVRDNVFPPFETAVRAIQTTFEQVSEGIGVAWEKIKEAAAAPVRFVVNTVYNDGIRKVVQNVLDALGVAFTLPTASLSFASGGVLPGYTPGSDVHHFWSPTAGALHLSGGEGIIRPDALRALGGESWLNLMNRTRGRAVSFAQGGVFGGGSGRGGITEFWDWIINPAKAIADAVTGPVDALMAQVNNSAFGKVLKALPPKIIGGLVDKVTALLSPLAGSAGGPEYGGPGGAFARPAAGPVTSEFGARAGGFHAGIDIGGSGPTWAVTNGSVLRSGWNTLAGRTGIGVILSHGGGNYSYYGHNPVGGVAVSAGQQVTTGQQIGRQGSTGNSTGNHLHFEWHQGGLGRAVNPRVLGLFDSGGYLPPGVSVVENRTGKPEPVLTSGQWDDVRGGAGAAEIGASVGVAVRDALDGATLNLGRVDALTGVITGQIVLATQRRAGR